MTLFLLLAVLFVPSIALAQVACFDYGEMISCNTPTGITTMAPIGSSGGVITQYGSGQNTLEPYTIISPSPPPARARRSISSRDMDATRHALPSLPPLGLLGLPGLPDPEMELP